MALNPRCRARSIDVSERALDPETFREVQTYEQEIATFNSNRISISHESRSSEIQSRTFCHDAYCVFLSKKVLVFL